jgi:hypothetical protein
MRYLNKWNESYESKSNELDWRLIKESLIDVLEVNQVLAKFHFYSTMTTPDGLYYNTYPVHNSRNGLPVKGSLIDLDVDSLKKENDQHTGDIYLRRFSDGSKLWGVQLEIRLDTIRDRLGKSMPSSIDDLSKFSEYFKDWHSTVSDIEVAIRRISGEKDYKIWLNYSLIIDSDRESKIILEIYDREILEIMQKEYRDFRDNESPGWLN